MLEPIFNHLWKRYEKLLEQKALPSPKEKNKKRRKEVLETLELIKKEKEKEILPPEIIRSEVNFLVFPFFALWDKDVHKRIETEYRSVICRNGEKLELLWNVSANPKYGYPGPFDKKVHKAIEQIISKQRPPIENPICIGSLYNLARMMGLKFSKSEIPSGRFYKQIKEALERIRMTGIKSKGAFYSKGKKKWIEDVFGLYDRVIFKGEELDDGKIADTNYLFLSSWYLDNLNARYVRPIDYTYYRALKNPIPQRLYEILGVKFYGYYDEIRYRYSTLCQLLPAKPQKYLSLAKQQLDPAHKELQRTKFLADYKWSENGKGKHDWLIYYYPGERFYEEQERFSQTIEAPKEEVEALPEAKPEIKEEKIIHIRFSPEYEEIWNQVLAKLEQKVTKANFEIWIKNTALVGIENHKVYIETLNQYAKEQLENRFQTIIEKAIAMVLDQKVEIEFLVVRE